MLIKGWGVEGQRRLKDSNVAIVGIGGLGCLSSSYLAAAGVGKIILIDKEISSYSDLNRQILYSNGDLGSNKAQTAKKKIESLNPEIEVEAIVKELTEGNVSDIVGNADVVVDGLDNWRTRFTINDCCVKRGIPFVHAGVSGFYGQIITIAPGKGPCLRCIFPKEPPEFEVVPIFGASPAVLASLQVMEVIKIITGIGDLLVGRILFLDGEEMTFESASIKRNPDCPVCASHGRR
jgi:molybdopterin/thiamine biosynthesis adenylyltransferase